jgi:hypothetical protein
MRTLKRKLGTKADAKSRRHLMAALCNRFTLRGARDSVEQALETAASPEKASYIRREWEASLPMWANCSREHSALLLQVTTTNPNEAYHRSLKALAGITKRTKSPRYSLNGIISVISQCDANYDARAQKQALNWQSKKLSATLDYPWLSGFKYHVQLLLLDEIKAAAELAESGADFRLGENGKCKCRFARAYLLPCRHVIYGFEHLGEIEEPDWSTFVELFDESGFDVYVTRTLVEVEDEERPLPRDVEAKHVTNEALDAVRTRFYEVVELTEDLDEEARDRLLKRWEQEVSKMARALIGPSVTEWMSREDQVICF